MRPAHGARANETEVPAGFGPMVPGPDGTEVPSPAGTIVNPLEPAPTTQGHMETGMRVNKLVADVVSQAVALSDDEVLRSRVAGQPSNGATSAALAGFDPRSNRPIVLFPMSPPHMQGGGGQTTNDGLDTYGAQCSLGNGVPAVEIEESTGPVMILWRQIRANSGGAGTYRGGQGAETALAIRGVPTTAGTSIQRRHRGTLARGVRRPSRSSVSLPPDPIEQSFRPVRVRHDAVARHVAGNVRATARQGGIDDRAGR